jgi:hypothetical protein
VSEPGPLPRNLPPYAVLWPNAVLWANAAMRMLAEANAWARRMARGLSGAGLDRPRQPIARRRGSSQRAYATRFSSLTSTSLQDGHTTKCKSGNPPSLGTLRTSFIIFPQDGQRCIGRLSAIFMIAIRVCPAGALIAESRREMVAKKQRDRTFLPLGRYHRREPCAFCASAAQGSRHDRASEPIISPDAHHI